MPEWCVMDSCDGMPAARAELGVTVGLPVLDPPHHGQHCLQPLANIAGAHRNGRPGGHGDVV